MRHLIILLGLVMMVSFQNCSKSSFEGAHALESPSTKSGVEDDLRLSEVIIPKYDNHNEDNQEDNYEDKDHTKDKHSSKEKDCKDDHYANDVETTLGDVVALNSACDPLFDAGSAQDLKGKDGSFNGAHTHLSIYNAGALNINGVSKSLSVNGSKYVSVSGAHEKICLKSKYFVLNGAYGTSGAPTVFIGQGDEATVNGVNGVSNADLVLINVKKVSAINGRSKDIYLDGSKVQHITGNGRNLYLSRGTVVQKISGHFENVYADQTSTVESYNGVVQVHP